MSHPFPTFNKVRIFYRRLDTKELVLYREIFPEPDDRGFFQEVFERVGVGKRWRDPEIHERQLYVISTSLLEEEKVLEIVVHERWLRERKERLGDLLPGQIFEIPNYQNVWLSVVENEHRGTVLCRQVIGDEPGAETLLRDDEEIRRAYLKWQPNDPATR